MISTGMVRKLDAVGRIVFPKEIRRTIDFEKNDALEIFTDEDTLIFRKYTPGCAFCNELSNLVEFKGIKLCTRCIEDIQKEDVSL